MIINVAYDEKNTLRPITADRERARKEEREESEETG